MLKAPLELRNGFKDKKRLADIHELPCIVCDMFGFEQKSRTEAHHLIGYGIGKKASDLLTIGLCKFHHTSGGKGEAIHSGVTAFEANFGTQEEMLEITNERINKL